MMNNCDKKIKVLFDGQLLAKAFMQKQTGIFRVCDEVFKRLAERKDIELYFLMTNKKGNPEQYLKSRGFDRLVSNIVRMPKLLKSSKHHSLYRKIFYYIYKFTLPLMYGKKLKQFDWYLSAYAGIPPVVKKSGLKSACVVHDMIPFLYPNYAKVYNLSRKSVENYINDISADIVFFISKSARDDFLRFRGYFDFNKTRIMYLGVDNIFSPQSKSDIEKSLKKYNIPSKPYLLCVSEANPRKNFAHVIRAFVDYLEKSDDKDLNLVIVGKKLPNYDYTKDGVDLEKYKNRVIITGYVDDADLPSLYSGATIFMYPSLYEGFGLPVLEAMQCGVPVITADNSSLPEVGGDAVAYVSGFDVEETSQMIQKVLTDKEFANNLIKKSLERAKLFSWDKTVEIMVKAIKSNL